MYFRVDGSVTRIYIHPVTHITHKIELANRRGQTNRQVADYREPYKIFAAIGAKAE